VALHNTIIGNTNNIIINHNIGPAGATTKESASVLLRIVALCALTHRERVNAVAVPVIATPEHLKLFSAYDCLFPFCGEILIPGAGRGRVVRCFPDHRLSDEHDLNIANGEFGVVVGGGTTTEHYIAFMEAVAGGGRAATVLGLVNAAILGGGPIPIADENIIALDIHNLYNDYAINHAIVPALNPVMNFFDEVNVVHYIHKLLARQNIRAVRELRGRTGAQTNRGGRTLIPEVRYNRTLQASVPNQGPSTVMHINKSGNFEGTLIGSWGPYANDINNSDAFTLLRNVFRGINPVNADEQELVRIFRDLYRLECIREPAALITNAIFVDLAIVNYTSINNDVYNFANIRDRMPMAPAGTVEATRRLWNHTMSVHNNIYYRYDYIRYGSITGNGAAELRVYSELKKLENNLLFNYIMHQADQLDTAHGGAGNITARLRTNVLTATVVVNQQVAFAGGINPWGVLGVVPPALVATIASIYEVTVPVTIPAVLPGEVATNHNIIFQARFPIGGAPIQVTDIFITSFPLMLINQLLSAWYRVNIGLIAAPNQDIQIDLQLRA
jgi:hypothetical protein